MNKPKYPRYNEACDFPKSGDKVARQQGEGVGEVGVHFAQGRGYSVVVDWGDGSILLEPMGELLLVERVPPALPEDAAPPVWVDDGCLFVRDTDGEIGIAELPGVLEVLRHEGLFPKAEQPDGEVEGDMRIAVAMMATVLERRCGDAELAEVLKRPAVAASISRAREYLKDSLNIPSTSLAAGCKLCAAGSPVEPHPVSGEPAWHSVAWEDGDYVRCEAAPTETADGA